jgi:hypothetical protein
MAHARLWGEDPQHLQNRYGRCGMCNEIMQARPIGQNRLVFDGEWHHFWKGAIVGALVTFI